MINFFRKLLYEKTKPIILANPKKIRLIKRNSKKIYYIIKRDRWHGMFSNLHYVLLHVIYSKKKNYIPIVDMENFPTIYNEKNKINNTFNSWNYYFQKYSYKKLDYIYKNKNIKFSDNSKLDTSKINKKYYKKYKKILKDNLINKSIIRHTNLFERKFFKNKKVIGIHFRGSDQKTAALHPFPPTFQQVNEILKKKISLDKSEIIFLATEEQKIWDKFKNIYGSRIIGYKSFRSNKDIFSYYPRRKHRYLLGYENIINMILLSKVDYLIHSNTNFSAMAIHYSKKKIKQSIIFNGFNSKNIFLANILWYLKSLLPMGLGGFISNVKNK